MSRTIYVIGIGAGDPEHLTLQAVAAMNRVDVFFTIDKGAVDGGATADLAALRAELLARHVTRPHRVVAAPEVPRDRDPAASAAYVDTATRWQLRRGMLYEAMIAEALRPGETGAFLVWGDPALYDGTLPLLQRIAERTHDQLRIVSIPGISSVAALAAAHRLVLNRVGAPVLITTGRRLADEGMPRDVDDVVVMLDGRTAFADLPDTDLDIFWGAYLGTPDELLVSGDLLAARDEIVRHRADGRARHGWIMDIYLLRRRPSARQRPALSGGRDRCPIGSPVAVDARRRCRFARDRARRPNISLPTSSPVDAPHGSAEHARPAPSPHPRARSPRRTACRHAAVGVVRQAAEGEGDPAGDGEGERRGLHGDRPVRLGAPGAPPRP